ncbi:MAG: CGGC domain-containing protein [bacterium]
MTKIAIVGCKRIQDHLCISCAMCLKAISKRDGEFSAYKDDQLELVAIGDCGDCPGLIMPKLSLMNTVLEKLGQEADIIHLGTCVVKASKTAKCPMDIENIQKMVLEKFGKGVVPGTHNYS